MGREGLARAVGLAGLRHQLEGEGDEQGDQGRDHELAGAGDELAAGSGS